MEQGDSLVIKRNSAEVPGGGEGLPGVGMPGGAVPGGGLPAGCRADALGDEAWRRQLAELATACAGSFPEDEADRLRHAHALLATAPSPAVLAGLAVPGQGRLAALLEAGGGTSAALALLGDDSGYLLSRGSDGEHLASVVLPGAQHDVTACGDTPALALVGAIARALALHGTCSAGLN